MITKMYRLGKGGMEKIEQMKNDLPIGTRVIAFGGYNSRSNWAVCGSQNEMVKMSTLSPDDYFVKPFRKGDPTMQPLSRKFGIGFYYDDINAEFKYTKEEIEKAKIRATEFIKKQDQEKESKEQRLVEMLKELPKRYPHLTENKDDDYKVTKRNLVAELKHRFPETKFSVRKRGYSSYDISWTSGAEWEKVNEVRHLFENHETDVTGDFRDYAPSAFNKMFGGFKYIFLNRQ